MKSLQNIWKESDLEKLSKALSFSYKLQNTYKEPLDLKDRITGWRFVLESDYNIEQVLYGLKQFLKKRKDMPVPADIIEILSPEKPRITEAEFVAAQKWQERNGYPMFSDAKTVIEDYRKQEQEKRKNHRIESEKIKSIVDDSLKEIE